MSSDHHPLRRPPDLPPLTAVTCFADSVSVMLGLLECYDRVTVAALLDDDGSVIDATPFIDPVGDPVDVAIGWILSMAGVLPGDQVVLFELDPSVDLSLDPEAVGRFFDVVERCDRACIELLDWQRSDGESVRSMAFTLFPDEAWDRDSPADRERARLLLGFDPASPG